MNQVTGKTITLWYRNMTVEDIGKFTPSLRGHALNAAISPFKDNEELKLKFKAWACTSLLHLTIRNAQDFINTDLSKDWSKKELANNNIDFPVST